jgi:N-acetylmuramoyl-L-alanine amidase
MRWIRAAAAAFLAGTGAALAQTPPAPMRQISPVPPPPSFPAAANPSVQPRFAVVIDAAHGGPDGGAKLQNNVLEKDITLALGERLRSLLRARGIEVVTTRDADVNLPVLHRAEVSNHARAAACLLLHATATGSGVHLFTSALAQAEPQRVEPWETAQAAYSTQSLKLEAEIDSAFAHAQVPVTLGRASVQPMDNLACPAVAVEVAPLVGGHVTSGRPVTDAAYQTSIVDAIAAALEQWRSDWRQ